MKLYHKVLTLLFYIFLLGILIYSYVLVDPNITFINNQIWAQMREKLIRFGYYQRELSSYIYIALVSILFLFHGYFLKNYKKLRLKTLISPLIVLGIVSYPFLSHDLFNYMFDAKIFTFYHQNPYIHKALDFPQDPWLRFLQWTHRSYPYGPTFLIISIIPSFLSFGKFLLSFLLFKTTVVGFYLLGVYFLNKQNKQWAVIFATNPLIIIEGLVNSHNDMIAVGLAVVGIYYLFEKKDIVARVFLLFSGGIKYLTLPLVFLSQKKSKIVLISIAFLLSLIFYISFTQTFQPWYFLALLILLPYYKDMVLRLNILFAGLLFSYYPFVRYGDWGTAGNIQMKNNIIYVFLGINLIYLLFVYFKKSKR